MAEYLNSRSEEKQEPRRTLHVPALLIAIGVWVLRLSAELPDFLQRGRRLPGPRYFPTLLGVFLCVAGTVELARYTAWRRRNRVTRRSVRTAIRSIRVTPAAVSATVILALVIAFAGTVRIVGFQIGAFLCSLVMLTWLRCELRRALVVAVVLVAIISLVFGYLFRVPLPRGVFITVF